MTTDNYDAVNYKALPVAETIKNLRKRLNDLDVFAFERQWWEVEHKNLVSLQVVLDDCQKVRTAGKGVNRQFALASGLAEMLERLQNLQFTHCISSCNKTIRYCYSDSKKMNYDEIETLHYFLPKYKNNIRILAEKKKDITTVPFYNVFKDVVEYFPYETLWYCTGSNGMCAGNTPCEALIQGICEVMERHVFYKIYFEKLTLPTVPEEMFKGTRHWQHISALKENGFSVEVKDCTLGGRMPVVGILVSKNNRATFCAGSASDFDIALERCFTETMQGRNMELLYQMMPEMKKSLTQEELVQQYKLALAKHTGSLPVNIFDGKKEADKNHLFWTADATSKETLKNLVKIIRDMGYDLFIRDVSFLGFPTYHVYVPRMSDNVLDRNDSLFDNKIYSHLKKTFFNTEKATKKDLSLLARAIDERIIHSKKHNIPISLLDYFGLSYRETCSLNMISPEILLIVLYCKLKEYGQALEKLSAFLKNYSCSDKKSTEVFNCFKRMLVMLKEGKKLTAIKETLSRRYSSDIIQENIMLIDSKYPLGKIYDIPKPAHCHDCKVCYFKELQVLAKKLNDKMAQYHFDQSRLKDILN